MKRRALLIWVIMMIAVLSATCFLGCSNIDITVNNNPTVSGKPNDDIGTDDPNTNNPNQNPEQGSQGQQTPEQGNQGQQTEQGNNEQGNGGQNTEHGNQGQGNQGQENQGQENQGQGNQGQGNTEQGNNEQQGQEQQQPENPGSTKVTVYYSDSDGFGNVYAYMWNYSSNTPKKDWPGEKLTSFGTSEYGQKQYKIEVDYSVYDRIIFNNGSSKKTKDLVVSGATSGYYGTDGVFTMDTDDYGRVIYKTLSDSKNLNYLPSKSKKISVYTPPGYSTAKKYGVLYIFDGQNLYAAANGSSAEQNGSRERWAVDVAVTNMVKNGCDGVIVVGIDDASSYRDQELTMSLSFGTLTSLGDPQYGSFRNGKLDELGNFIKETVMPWVKQNYSVDDSRSKTGIAGSSSGGLAAYYLGLRDNDLYGYIGAFSPANGLFTNSDWNRFYKSKNFGAGKPKVYVYCGQNDNDLEDMLLPETKRVKSGLSSYGIDVTENYVDGGTHNEVYWRIAFAEFLGKLAPK